MPQSSLRRPMIVTAAAAIAAATYLRYAVKPVAVAFRTGRALGLAERDQDVKVLIHAVADATRMLQDADLWHPAGKETQDAPVSS